MRKKICFLGVYAVKLESLYSCYVKDNEQTNFYPKKNPWIQTKEGGTFFVNPRTIIFTSK